VILFFFTVVLKHGCTTVFLSCAVCAALAACNYYGLLRADCLGQLIEKISILGVSKSLISHLSH